MRLRYSDQRRDKCDAIHRLSESESVRIGPCSAIRCVAAVGEVLPVVPVCGSQKPGTTSATGTTHCHYSLFPSIPRDFTGTIAAIGTTPPALLKDPFCCIAVSSDTKCITPYITLPSSSPRCVEWPTLKKIATFLLHLSVNLSTVCMSINIYTVAYIYAYITTERFKFNSAVRAHQPKFVRGCYRPPTAVRYVTGHELFPDTTHPLRTGKHRQ